MVRRAGRLLKLVARFGLVLLAIVGAAHIATVSLRPGARGMGPEACRPTGSGTLHNAGMWLRYLMGDIPALDDWPGTCAFAAANADVARLEQKLELVFIGDSITQHWLAADPALFGETRLNRGIPGQSSAQVLTRFPTDVVALRPRVVHLLSGTNDVIGLRGPVTPEIWQATMRSLVDLARTNGIVVILGTMPPLARNDYEPRHHPASIIAEQNTWLRALAKEKGLVLADYYSALAAADGGFRQGLSDDGTHPNAAGYAAMRKVLDRSLVESEGLTPPR